MAGSEIAIPEGRAVSAPETPHGGRTSDVTGIISVRLVASSLEAMVVVNPTAPAAYAVISGDKNEEVSVAWQNGMWTFTWPEDAGVSYTHTSVNFGRMQVNSFGRGGGVFVNGVRVDNLGGPAKEQPKVHLILPSGCSLYAEIQAGGVEVPATANERHGMALVSLSGSSAGLWTRCAVGQVSFRSQSGGLTADGYTGPVSADTMSGSVDLFHAAGNVQAKSMSGSVGVHCEDSILVQASSMSGSVHVTAAEGAAPTGSGSSMSGSVRVPATMSGGGRRAW